jgi:hypothetical protein
VSTFILDSKVVLIHTTLGLGGDRNRDALHCAITWVSAPLALGDFDEALAD